jgi:hypothetical protein
VSIPSGRRKQRGDEHFPTDPVRAHSWDVDDHRAKPGRPIGDRTAAYFWAWKDALLRTLKHELRRQADEGHGDDVKLHWTAPRVLEAALQFCDRRTGDFFVSYQAIASQAKVHPNTAKNAIRALEDWGFLAHVRRSRQREGSEGVAGPQREQAPNAYYFDCEARMPTELWQLLYKTLKANLTRATAAAKRHAGLIRQTFNGKAMPAPRPSDGKRGPEWLAGITNPEMRARLRRMGDMILQRERAVGASAST